jgi:hypothetical protein
MEFVKDIAGTRTELMRANAADHLGPATVGPHEHGTHVVFRIRPRQHGLLLQLKPLLTRGIHEEFVFGRFSLIERIQQILPFGFIIGSRLTKNQQTD